MDGAATVPAVTVREVIQPLPAFRGICVAHLKAPHNAILAERLPASAGVR